MQRLLLATADVIGSSAATQTTLGSFHIICIIFGHFFKLGLSIRGQLN